MTLPIQQARGLATCPGIVHGFFGRKGGVSRGAFKSLNVSLRNADDTASAWENRRRVVGHFGVEPERLVILRQVHGTVCLLLDAPIDPSAPPEGDGLCTTQPGLLLGVTTADCAPILFADPDAAIVAACHAGWRGALDGITDRTLEAMLQAGARLDNIRAALGPMIAQASYEVGPKFQESFEQADPENARHFMTPAGAPRPHFDLRGYLTSRLQESGLRQIEQIAIDTLANERDYFSYRRATLSGQRDFGLQVAVIGLADQVG